MPQIKIVFNLSLSYNSEVNRAKQTLSTSLSTCQCRERGHLVSTVKTAMKNYEAINYSVLRDGE